MRLLRLFAALLLTVPTAAAAEVQARLTPELALGGGWASSLLVGNDFPHWQTHVAPGVAFDLSTGPVVKILSAYRLTWSRYGADASSLLHDGELTVRIRLSRAFDLDLRGALEQVDFEDITGSTSGDPSAPPATASLGLDAGPLLRWRLDDRTRAEAAIGVGRRANQLGEGLSIDEDFQRASLAVVRRLGPALEAGLRYGHVRSRAGDTLWDFDGDGAQLSLAAAPLGDLVLRGHAGVQWTRFSAGDRTDRFAYLGAAASLPVAPATTAEIAWSLGDNAVLDGTADLDRRSFEGSRHVLWSGLRVEAPWWL